MSLNFYPASKKTLALVALFWLLGNTNASLAQQPVSASSRLEQSTHLMLKDGSFTAALETIIQQTHVAIVAEGVPADKKVELAVNGSLRAVLDRVADEFDYTWREGSDGVILMNKRFKDAKSAPQTHLSEMRQVTSNILTILQTLSPDTNGVEWPDLELALANTFTLEQTQLLQHGDRLYASALSPSQLQQMKTIIGNATFGVECFRWKDLSRAFNAMQRSELVLTVTNGVKFFAVHDPLTDTNVPQGITLGRSGFTKKNNDNP
ncbi:MAG: hypothetical protein JWL77_5163 [Chthonomonadaceae bacterium]|nr:hypothetical protein [Chthonomonadaceae bacterium]